MQHIGEHSDSQSPVLAADCGVEPRPTLPPVVLKRAFSLLKGFAELFFESFDSLQRVLLGMGRPIPFRSPEVDQFRREEEQRRFSLLF